MDLDDRFRDLENEVKLLKNEVHQTLLDIKDSLAGGFQAPPASPPSREREEFRVRAEELPPTAQRQETLAGQPRAAVGVTTSGERGEESRARDDEPAPKVEREAETYQADEEEAPERSSVVREPFSLPVGEGPVKARRETSGRIDLATLATLGNWADRSARRVGRERVEAILEVYEVTGYLPRNLKQVLLKLLTLDDAPVTEQGVSLRECITVLLELNGLLIGHSKTEAAMLGLLVNGHNSRSKE